MSIRRRLKALSNQQLIALGVQKTTIPYSELRKMTKKELVRSLINVKKVLEPQKV